MFGDRVILIGVRHHSPACARMVRRVIERARPALVLIEGPSDYNPAMDDLKLAHTLPVAIFSFCAQGDRLRSCYAPFCDHSPEWQALRSAWAVGASPLFCDLPVWHPDFGNQINRYADPQHPSHRYGAVLAALGRRLEEEGPDAVWDALAEQAEDAALPVVLERYFAGLRPAGLADPAEAAREAWMGQYAAWAVREAGGRPVVVVCGGWHVGGLREAMRRADGTAPPTCPPTGPPTGEPAADQRTGAYLVPYSDRQLDRLVGYAAGMPSPGYYRTIHTLGLEAAADWAMAAIAGALREAGQVVSTADWIAWRAHAQALARLRGHRTLLRTDILDAALSTLIKEALETPPPWAQAGRISRGDDPGILVMLRALAGTQQGTVSPAARRPPLLADVEARLHDAGLAPDRRYRRVVLDWADPAARQRAHTLHQLLILGLPGVARVSGPAHAAERSLSETFEIIQHRDWTGALIEASVWGGTLPAAAAARLEARIADGRDDLEQLAAALSRSLFAGLLGLGDGLTERLAAGIGLGHKIGTLGRAGRLIAELYRFGEIFGTNAHDGLGRLGEAVFARALWLFEGVHGAGEGLQAIDAVLACRDLARGCDRLALDRPTAAAVLARCAADEATPPGLAGAALGYLVACGEQAASSAAITERIRRFALPERLGDFLAGLFALAREELRSPGETLRSVDALVAAWSDEDFLRALPALRLAFTWFPPREREALAQTLMRHHGLGPSTAALEALAWMRQDTAIYDQAAALALEAHTAERLARYGLALR